MNYDNVDGPGGYGRNDDGSDYTNTLTKDNDRLVKQNNKLREIIKQLILHPDDDLTIKKAKSMILFT